MKGLKQLFATVVLVMGFIGGCHVGGMDAGPFQAESKLYMRIDGKVPACSLQEMRESSRCTTKCETNDRACLYQCWYKHLSPVCNACTLKRYQGERNRSCLVK